MSQQGGRDNAGSNPSEKILLQPLALTRRQNLLALFQQHAEQARAGGASIKGLEQAFAATLQISPSMWSQIKSTRPIGDRLARQFEQLCGKPAGWLDEPGTAPVPPSPVEQAFLDIALAAWRATDAEGRRSLKEQLTQVIETPPAS